MRIYLVSGKAEHGKDTLAGYLKEAIEKTSDKKVLIAHNGDLLKYCARTFYNWDGEKDVFGRQLLQDIGASFREKYPSYWVDFLISSFDVLDSWDVIIIPDTRYENEISQWEKTDHSVVTIRVNRKNHISKLTPKQLKHQSEIDLDDYEHFDFIINAENCAELELASKEIIQVS